jgi:hypothetical protein
MMVETGRKYPVSGSGRNKFAVADIDDIRDEETREMNGIEMGRQADEGMKESDDVEQSNETDEKTEEMLDSREHHERENC